METQPRCHQNNFQSMELNLEMGTSMLSAMASRILSSGLQSMTMVALWFKTILTYSRLTTWQWPTWQCTIQMATKLWYSVSLIIFLLFLWTLSMSLKHQVSEDPLVYSTLQTKEASAWATRSSQISTKKQLNTIWTGESIIQSFNVFGILLSN